MFKKFVLPITTATITFAASSLALANGFYAGGEVGITALQNQITHTDSSSINILGDAPLSFSSDHKSTKVLVASMVVY